jgi:hypothetical protein
MMKRAMKGNGRAMIEYCKYVLGKFSFNPRLFKKEYRKCFKFLTPETHAEFRNWARAKFRMARKSMMVEKTTLTNLIFMVLENMSALV